MDAGFKKHREEKDIYEMTFVNRVAVGETISDPEVRISLGHLDGTWEDVTGDVLAVVVVVGSKIQFTLKDAASDDVQPASTNYRVFAKVTTSQGRIIVGEADLEITE